MATLRESSATKLLRSLELLDIPAGIELREQQEEYRDMDWDYDCSPSLEELRPARFPNLRRFRIAGQYTAADEVHLVLRNMPRLEQLAISARYLEAEAIGSTKLPQLKVLELERFADQPLEAIANNRSLTRLEEIHLYPRALDPGDEPYLDLAGMRMLCAADHMPSLCRLSLKSSHFGDEGIDLLIRSGLLGRLRSLDLEYGAVTDVGAQLLAATDLRRLELLNVNGNYISPERVLELRAACPRLISDRQHFGEPDDDLQHLFYGDME